MLIAASYERRRRRQRTVREEYLRSLLEPSTGTSPLQEELQRAGEELTRRLATLPAGPERATAQTNIVNEIADRLVSSAERVFILDLDRSTLELLGPAERDRFLGFAWQHDDFPGSRRGPNEGRAEDMFAALTRLCPERRPNQGSTAVVRRDEFDAAMERRIDDALVSVPGEHGLKLHRDAAAAFVAMRTAAAAEGVTLAIGNSFRPAERAQANAAAAGNRAAVASFSSHTLGLAVDMRMSHSGRRFASATRPFQGLVNLYKSPVHKWLFLRAEAHGWFPYRREPWHWEYNPPGFRDRFRQSSPTPAVAEQAFELAEAITDPVPPLRPPLTINGSVGRTGRNTAADVRAVQDRLVELRLLDAATIATERSSDTAAVAESALPRTIEAIETFQRQIGLADSGLVDVRSDTRNELDRAIPVPTASELTSVARERATINQTLKRGLSISGPVGDTPTGNAPDDVRAVQRRLVDLRKLSASHGETPATGATGTIAAARLPATVAAIRRVQEEVRSFVRSGKVTGAVTAGVINPGDATFSLLDRTAAYDMALGTARIWFRDHVRSSYTVNLTGVSFAGSSSPSAIPIQTFIDIGLKRGEAAALRLVSTFEGNFDAINTYDRAVVSVGFIQFAGGGRGLAPYVALLKGRQPAKFRELLQKYGVDVEYGVSGGAIARGPRMVVLDPAGARILRGDAAETAIRDDKRLTTALILSGRDADVQRVQIEAAAHNYVRPILAARVTWRGGRGATLAEIFRSQKGMAILFDRTIQEGLSAAQRRFERVIRTVTRDPGTKPPPPAPTLDDLRRREGDLLSEVERDLQSAHDVGASLTRARERLDTLVAAASAAGATVAAIASRPELADVRQAVTAALVALDGVSNVSPAAGASVDATLANMRSSLDAERTRLALTSVPASVGALSTALTESRQTLTAVARPVATASTYLDRVKRIRRSTLDAGLAEVA